MFVNTAYAADAAAQQGSPMSLIVMMTAFFLFFYVILIRPKQKKEKQQRELMNSINTGDEVITYAGLMGKVVRSKDNYLVLSIADNVEIKIQRNYISNVLPKGTLKSI
jgi:preprotein translocase subunit YajC